MSGYSKIAALIEKKEQEIQSLEQKIAEERLVLKGLQEAFNLLPKEPSDSGGLREGSDVAKAREAILTAGRPLHVKEILTRIGKEETKGNLNSLNASLSKYVDKRAFFIKAAPSTFGLMGRGVDKIENDA